MWIKDLNKGSETGSEPLRHMDHVTWCSCECLWPLNFFQNIRNAIKMIMKSRKHFKALDDLLSKTKFLRN